VSHVRKRSAALVASTVLLLIVGGAQAEAGKRKRCSPDDGQHVAKVRLHVNPGPSLEGYEIKYTRRSGFRLGATNNEFVFYTPLQAPWWVSPDRGIPGRWLNRDRMSNIDGRVERLYIEAEFDKRDDDDPTCMMIWDRLR
jgi:hypothetical protein